MAVQSSSRRSRTNGHLGGQGHGFIAVCHAGGAPEVAKVYTLFIHGWASWIMPLSQRWSAQIMILTMLPSSGRLLLSRVMMLSNSIQHVRFFHRLPVSALRACLCGRLSFRRWRLPCHYLLWGPLLQSTPIVFWRRSRWILKRCWELWTERIRHPQGGEDS
jgi:hypothetical protein